MQTTHSYRVIAPIEGMQLSHDFRIYSAELYGNAPDHIPSPGTCNVFRQPYELISPIHSQDYTFLAKKCSIDEDSVQALKSSPGFTLKQFACLAFEVSLDEPSYTTTLTPQTDNALLQKLLNTAERIVDVFRLALFEPGEDRSIGRVGALGGGVYGLWLFYEDTPPKFIARRMSRYQLVQPLYEVDLEDLQLLYYDFTLRSLSVTACSSEDVIHPILYRVFLGLQGFRESREMQSWEARFRHLGAIVEGLAKTEDEYRRNTVLSGDKLRNRIARIATSGWETYVSYGSSVLTPLKLPPQQRERFYERQKKLEWETENNSYHVVDDLWKNVRNPLSHTLTSVATLNRDPFKDMVNMERLVITMLNGICAAYEVSDLFEKSTYDVLLRERKK